MTIVGYTDRLSVAPGEEIRFMVSCERPRYDVRLVQLIHGDTNPEGPGFKQRPVASAIDGSRPGKRESIHGGSWFEAALGGVHLSPALTFCAFVQATNPVAGVVQVIASQGQPLDGAGWALALSARGELQVIGAGEVVARLGPMRRWQWYLVALSLQDGDAGAARDGGGTAVAGTAWRWPVRTWPDDPPVEATLAADAKA